MQRTWRWVTTQTNHDNDPLSFVCIWTDAWRPRTDVEGEWWCGDDDHALVCAKEFKAIFGFLPTPQKPIKVEFSGKILEESDEKESVPVVVSSGGLRHC